MASCGGTLVKLVLGIFNFIWMAIGGFLVYLGVRALDFNQNSDDIRALVDTNFQTGALVLLAFGVAVVLISAIGFVGACCESSAMLNFYGFIMFVLLVGSILLVYFGYRYRGDLQDKFDKGITNGIKDFNKDTKIAYALQKIQLLFQCCGWNDHNDYSMSGGRVPASCCGEAVKLSNSTATCSSSDIVYNSGCRTSPIVEKYFGQITYSAYAIILLQLIIILAACCLARDLRSSAY